jgi:N-acetyl-gamma-glutamyl-phosphate reductase
LVRVGILNVTGYMGAEAARLLHGHPQLELTSVTGRSEAGKPLGEVFPHLAPLGLTVQEELGEVDAVVSALPHGASAQALLPYIERGIPVVDLSSDFRLKKAEEYERFHGPHPAPEPLSQAVYGIPELRRDEIARAKIVANAGCHAAAAILGLAPAVQAGLVDGNIVVDSKTGLSGAGRSLKLSSHFSEANEAVVAYGFDGHYQQPEMTQELGALWEAPPPRIAFIPHLVPITRGIMVTAYAAPRDGTTVIGNPTKHLRKLYADFYASSPFVHVADVPPSTKQTLGSNHCLVYPAYDAAARRFVIVSCLDNLGKGGAAQGVQCLNLMLGLPETAGLTALPLYP